MKGTDQKDEGKKKKTEPTTYLVPFTLGELKEDFSISTNTQTKLSKEQIINKAIRLHSEGKTEEAEKYYLSCLNHGFNDYRVFANYGIILKSFGSLEHAEKTFRKAIELKFDLPEAHINLGNTLKDLGRLKEAEKSIRIAIKIKPDLAEAYVNLGTILKDLSRLKEAEIETLKAIKINPNLYMAFINLGGILKDRGKLNEAEIAIRKAIKIKSNSAEAYTNLGAILKDLDKLKKAEIATVEAIKLKPNFAIAYSNLGGIFLDLGRTKEAEIAIRRAVSINYKSSEYHYNLAKILTKNKKYSAAISSYKNSLKLKNDFLLAKLGLMWCEKLTCKWSNTNQNNILNAIDEIDYVQPWFLMSMEDNPTNHLKRAKNLCKSKYSRETLEMKLKIKNKIRIGYFSSDFFDHATMHLMLRIFELHNKSKFEIYIYDYSQKHDEEITRRLKSSTHFYRDIRDLDNPDSVKLARHDDLDIAVDLKGHTNNNRISIFAYRVAPIQISYLGYPGSTGMDSMDYLIADRVLIPNDKQISYSEEIIYMPNCYQCNDDKKIISNEKFSKKSLNIPTNSFVFTCFNSNYKISSKEFDIWMRLLLKKEESVLWLYKSNKWSEINLKEEALKRGVEPNRLIFAKKMPLKKHLARIKYGGDLALDTFNCNGHTTTSDALWAGLPILTLIGESFSARVSASLLTTLGITELITYSEQEYESTAYRLSECPEEILNIRQKIAKAIKSSPLFNSKLFTRDLENKYIELTNKDKSN